MIRSKLGPARAELFEASGDLKLVHGKIILWKFWMMSMEAPGIFWIKLTKQKATSFLGSCKIFRPTKY